MSSENNIFKTFRNAGKGFMEMLRSERNARIHFMISLAVIIAGVLLQISPAEWLFIFFTIGFVLAAEAFNTSLEKLTDIVEPEFHKDAGLVKDIAAAGVLVAALTAVVTGLIIFLPHLIRVFEKV